jgi:hypothetical protein
MVGRREQAGSARTNVSVFRCRNATHQELFHGECWHGSCPICHKGVTAFDFSAADAQKMVDAHIEREHPVDDDEPDW